MRRHYSLAIRGWVLVGLISVYGCSSSKKITSEASPKTYKLVSVTGSKTEMNSSWDTYPNEEALAVFAPYKAKIDSIMTPVIGRSAMDMSPGRPESLLSNLVADVLRESAKQYTGHAADIGITNMGGLRNSLRKGDITYGDIYEILPFENALCVLMMRGNVVRELMENIVTVRGEGVSNIKLTVNNKMEIEECTVGGEPIDDNRLYYVATLDYLAEGNDKLVAFRKAEDKICLPEATIREIFLNYIKELASQGKEVTSKMEGRITLIN